MTTTKQVKTPPNPTGKGGFADNPQNRNNGAWKKSDTLRYKIEKASSLSEAELQEIIDDPNEAKLIRQFATATLKADWRMIKEITEILYGKPKESIDLSNQDGTLAPKIALVEFTNGKSKRTDTKGV